MYKEWTTAVERDEKGPFIDYECDIVRPVINAGNADLGGSSNSLRTAIEETEDLKVAWKNRTAFAEKETVKAKRRYSTTQVLVTNDVWTEMWFVQYVPIPHIRHGHYGGK